jgi:hypothetical protein
MKGGWIAGLLCTTVLWILWTGCASRPVSVVEVEEPAARPTAEVAVIMVPLTEAILERLGSSLEGGIQSVLNQFQVYLSTHLIMEREEMKPSTMIENGKIRIEDVYTRSRIVVKAHTPGVASELREGREEAILVVNMDNDENNKLFFSNRQPEAGENTWFYLQHISTGASASGDERGSIKYGNDIYKITYTGKTRPYLLITMDQTISERTESRSAEGKFLEQ